MRCDRHEPSETLLARVAVSKYADGLPLYRQKGIYARDDVEISRNTMANWMAMSASISLRSLSASWR